MITFAEELLLLVMDEEYGEALNIPARTLSYALAGASLMDLALENRIDTGVEALVVTNPEPLGDSLLDPMLADIVALPGNPRTPDFWVRRVAERSEELRIATLERLAARGIVEADDSGFFSFSRLAQRGRRYSATQVQQEQPVRLRILQVIFSDEIPDIRDIVIIGLAHACGIFPFILSEAEYQEARERIEFISRLELLSRSVIEAIQNLTLAESQALRRTIQEKGGGWPRASGYLPFIGHILQLREGTEAFLTEQYRRLGPVFEISLFSRKYLTLAGPEANRFFLRSGKDYLQASREIWPDFCQEFGATKVIAALDGAEHLRLRKAMRDGYSRKPLLQNLSETVAIIDYEMSQWPMNHPITGFYHIQRMGMYQLGLVMAGTPARDHVKDLIDFLHALEFTLLMRMYPKFMLRMPKVRRARARIRLLFERVLMAHEPTLRAGEEPNLVDALMELRHSSPEFMTDTDLLVNVMGPYLAGADTSTGAASFMLYMLLKRPDLLEPVREEADRLFADGTPTPEGLQNMPVTQRVILETLRLYPIVPIQPRTAVNTFNFGGYWIPAGTEVWLAMTVPHHLPEIYRDPDEFDIDRFTPERREHSQPGVFAPFGLGMHSCLGQGAAQIQMALLVATILHRAEIALDPPDYELKISHTPMPKPNPGFRFRVLKWRHTPSGEGYDDRS